jgi:Flp pilus assembly protein TadG
LYIYRLQSSVQRKSAFAAARAAVHSVEFAIVSLVFFTVVLGIFEMCRVFMVCHLLSEGSRRACRTIVVEGTSNTDAQTALDNYLPNSGVNGYSMSVLVNDVVANASTANADDEVTVKVSVPVSSITWIPGRALFFTGSLTEQSTLRRE